MSPGESRPNDALTVGSPSRAPLYKEVKRSLMKSLAAGEWKPGQAIPSERELAARFQVAIGTLRKAIDELTAENILVRQQGRGTFVAAHNQDRLMFYFFHIVRKNGGKEYPEVETLSFAKGRADAAESAKLRLERDAPVFRIVNRLSIGGEPVILDRIAIPQRLFPRLTARQFARRPNTIYHLYQTAFAVTVVRSSERLAAVSADGPTAKRLNIAAGTPLLEIRRVALTYNEAPVEYRRSLVHTAHFEYFSELGG